MGFADSISGLVTGFAEQNAANEAEERLKKLKELQFDERDYDQVDYMGDFAPTLYDTPEAAAYQTIGEDPRVRGIEMDALQQLIDRASGAADAKSNAARFGAMDEANQLARSREDAIKMDMARKGQSGSGMDAVMRAQASQMAANRARAGTMDAVEQAALEKLAATEGAIGAAGGVRSRDFQRNAANSDIVNRFNMFNTQARNQAAQGNVNMQNQAGLRNIETKQGLSGTNTGIRNSSLNRKDTNTVREYDAKMGRFDRERGIVNQATGAAGKIAGGVAGLGETAIRTGLAGAGGGGAATGMKAAGTMADWDPEKSWAGGMA